MDLEVEVAPESKPSPDEILNVRLLKGTMFVERKYIRFLKYAVKNSGGESKKVLVEYPVEPEWKLVNPKEPVEKTRSEYCFTVEAKPGEPASLALEFQRTETQGIGLSDINDNTIRIYQSAKVVRDEIAGFQKKENELKKALDEYLMGLNIQ